MCIVVPEYHNTIMNDTLIEVQKDKSLSVWDLSPAQQAFVFGIASGKSQKDSYLDGHPNAGVNTAYVEGSRAIRQPKIIAAIQGVQQSRYFKQQCRMKYLGDLAIDNVHEALKNGDVSVSLEVLTRIGISPQALARLEVTAGRSDGFDDFLQRIVKPSP